MVREAMSDDCISVKTSGNTRPGPLKVDSIRNEHATVTPCIGFPIGTYDVRVDGGPSYEERREQVAEALAYLCETLFEVDAAAVWNMMRGPQPIDASET